MGYTPNARVFGLDIGQSDLSTRNGHDAFGMSTRRKNRLIDS